jgi:ankyrin repeat protein
MHTHEVFVVVVGICFDDCCLCCTDWAALNQQLEAVRVLLEQYPDQDVLAKNTAGRSALTEAFSTGNMEVVNLLLQHPSASEERFQATEDAAEGEGDEAKDNAGAEHSDEINTENAVEHEFRLADDKSIRIRELVRSSKTTTNATNV